MKRLIPHILWMALLTFSFESRAQITENLCDSFPAPNIWTINSCGIVAHYNDGFGPIAGNNDVPMEFRVYNRWGEIMWETTDATAVWDLKINGAQVPSGQYVCQLIRVCSEEKETINFHLTVIL